MKKTKPDDDLSLNVECNEEDEPGFEEDKRSDNSRDEPASEGQ
jgi:hypothetical protein